MNKVNLEDTLHHCKQLNLMFIELILQSAHHVATQLGGIIFIPIFRFSADFPLEQNRNQ